MAKRRAFPEGSLVIERGQPLIGIPVVEDGREVTYYFAGDAVADEAAAAGDLPRALSLAGAWSDLDWEETITALERIRKESPPTPPIGE